MKSLFHLAALALSVGIGATSVFAADAPAKTPESVDVYFGTYTGKTSKGIYVSKLKLSDGSLSEPVLAAESNSPSFLAVHPSKKYLFACNESAAVDGKKVGVVSGFAINADGKLTALNQQPSGGAGPCYVAVDKTGKTLLTANYGGGSVESLPIGEDGKLGAPATFIQHEGSSADPSRQKGPHAHCIDPSPDNRFVLACDLGLDKVLIYKLDPAKSTLTPNDPPFGVVKPTSGPRHLAFHPSGKYVYVINEMASTVTAFAFDAQKGAMAELNTLSTLPEPVKGNSTAEIMMHPSGKFVFGSNRGHNSIAVFKVLDDGKLEAAGQFKSGGKTPRGFGIDPTGTYLVAAHQDSDDVYVHKIDQATGALTPTGAKINVGKAVSVVFVAK